MLNTPILFLIFNRPDTERRVFESIRQIRPKRLYIAADGPRSDHPEDTRLCEFARNIVDTGVDWPCLVKKLYRKKNLGCKQAVSMALDWFFENEEEGIILEDDCLPGQSFYPFCRELLIRYRDDKNIFLISGTSNVPFRVDKYSYSFSKYPHIWGWASWRRSWEKYDVNMVDWPQVKHNYEINFGLLENEYWRRVFETVYRNKINTWDYQLMYCCLKNKMLSIRPAVNLVKNIGIGPQATHTTQSVITPDSFKMIFPLKHPSFIRTKFIVDLYTSYFHHQINLIALGSGLVRNIFNKTFTFIQTRYLSFMDPIVTSKIGNYDIKHRYNHRLFAYLKYYPNYDVNMARIVEIVYKKYLNTSAIDIGANIGDSAALIKTRVNIPILCIDPDDHYFSLLEENTKQFQDVVISKALLGNKNLIIKGSFNAKNGTSHLNKSGKTMKMEKLDNILIKYSQFSKSKFIKIDTDGFDGYIIEGGRQYLRSVHPVLYFEYDPYFLSNSGYKPLSIFSLLKYLGYRYALVYSNTGDYKTDFDLNDTETIKEYHQQIANMSGSRYYDICVFSNDDKDLFYKIKLAELNQWK